MNTRKRSKSRWKLLRVLFQRYVPAHACASCMEKTRCDAHFSHLRGAYNSFFAEIVHAHASVRLYDMQVTRGRGQFTAAEKASSRPIARKSSNTNMKIALQEPEEQVVLTAAPRSSGRNAMKQRSTSTASLLSRKPSLTSNSALPTPALRSAIAAPKMTRGAAASGSDIQLAGKENNDPSAVACNTRVRDAFSTTFAENRVESLEELLKFRSKASKFNAKARQDEQVGYIRQLKAAVRAVCDEVRLAVSLYVRKASSSVRNSSLRLVLFRSVLSIRWQRLWMTKFTPNELSLRDGWQCWRNP